MQAYKISRLVTFVCLLAIIVISGFFLFGNTDAKLYAVISGLIAILATVASIYAAKPLKKDDFTDAVSQVLVTYDKDTYEKLQKAQQEEHEIREFIDHQSEQLLLLKMRIYLISEVKSRYDELSKVEDKLDSMHVQYGVYQLPEKFQNLMEELELQEREDEQQKMINKVVDAFPIPTYAKTFIKGYVHLIMTMLPDTLASLGIPTSTIRKSLKKK